MSERGPANKHVARYTDCFAYALSKGTGLPLLLKGDDLTKIDLAGALGRPDFDSCTYRFGARRSPRSHETKGCTGSGR
jgi:hypothetical protein